MENKFFSFIKPYLESIDNGSFFRKPFGWIYVIIAVLNLLFPVFIFINAVDGYIFDSPAKYIVAFILIWLVLAFAGWISFQLWWDRKAKLNASSLPSDDYVATPAFSHFIQTYGEWLGTYIGIVGGLCTLIVMLFLGEDGRYFSRSLDLPFIDGGWLSVVLLPIFGYLIIVVTRFLAEQIKALVSIANNTKK